MSGETQSQKKRQQQQKQQKNGTNATHIRIERILNHDEAGKENKQKRFLIIQPTGKLWKKTKLEH